MKGIVVTSTVGITGKGEAKTRLTLICFNKRKKGKKIAELAQKKQMGREGDSAQTQNFNIW